MAKRGAVRGLDIANSPDLTPLWDPYWNPLWEVIQTSGLPLHFHTIGSRLPENLQKLVFVGSDPSRATADMTAEDRRASRIAFATHITGFQINMANILMAMIYGGVLERFPRLRVVLGEAGIGWIPYILWRMDGEWEDQFKDLSLTHAAQRVLEAPGVGHLPDRPGGREAARRAGRGQGDVGLGLPASRRGVAGLEGVHRRASSATSPRTFGARSSARTRRGSTTSLSGLAAIPGRRGGAGGGAADHGRLRPPA